MVRARPPIPPCKTAEEWVFADLERQRNLWEKYGNKAPKLCAPTPEELPDANERARVASLQMKVCTKDCHVGDRVLSPDQTFGKDRVCKSCKTNAQKANRAEAAVVKEDAKVGKYKTADEWFEEASTANSRGSRYFPPDRIFFPSDEEYEKALSLHNDRNKHGGDGRDSIAQYMDRDNANKRAAYSKMSKQEKRAKYNHFTNGKSHVSKRGIAWNISSSKEEALRSAIECYFCHHKADPSSEETVLIRGNQCRTGILGIDRLEPVPSYDDEGVVSACFRCNASKGGWGYSDFVNFCSAVAKFQVTGEPNTTFIPYQRTVRRPSSSASSSAASSSSVSSIASSSSDPIPSSEFEYELDGIKWTQKTVSFNTAICFSDYRYNAKKRNLKFDICKLDFENMVSKKCTFCGFFEKGKIGLDRIDTSKGYLFTNVHPSCVTCNHARGDLTVESFIDMCKSISKIHSSLDRDSELRLSLLSQVTLKKSAKTLPSYPHPPQ